MRKSRSFTTKPLPSIGKAKMMLADRHVPNDAKGKIVDKAIKDVAAETGFTEDEVRDSIIRQLMDQQQPSLTPEDLKAQQIISNIQKSIPAEEKAQWLKADCKIHNLMIDLKKAEKDKRYTAVAVINRQLDARAEEVVLEASVKMMQKYVDSGEIIKFMDEDDAERYDTVRGLIFLCMDALDSTLNDLTHVIRSCGMYGEVQMLSPLLTAREKIQEWCDAGMRRHDEMTKDLILEEADKVYEYAKERMPILRRKCERHIQKLQKEKEKEQNN